MTAESRLPAQNAINTSLSTLGKCIAALAGPTRSHVPFREAKLTRLLQAPRRFLAHHP